MVKEAFVRRLYNLILISFLVFALAISAYFYFSAKTDVDTIDASLALIAGDLADIGLVDPVSQGVSNLFGLVIFQIATFLLATISLLFLAWFVFRLYTVEKKSALIDPLTEQLNRRAVLFGLGHELLRARRFMHPLSVAVVDIDHFKKYNDLNGHVAGDRALKTVAKILKEGIRGIDMVGRIGGEEFLIIFPETNVKEASQICERLRKNVERKQFPGEEELPNKKLTISVGISGREEHKRVRNKFVLMDKADKRLYLAKEAGRNVVK